MSIVHYRVIIVVAILNTVAVVVVVVADDVVAINIVATVAINAIERI